MQKEWINGFPDRESKKKLWKIMKLTIVLIIGFMITVSANSYSQKTRLDVNLSNTTIKDLFGYIEQTSKFVFLYRNEDFNTTKKVSIDIKDATINQILEQVLKDEKVVYDVYERQIVIRKAGEPDLNGQQPQKKEISGKVHDSNGLLLPGVSVVVKGTTTGIVTDADGKFTLAVPANAKTLVFSFVGMKSLEIAISGKTIINVVMEEAKFDIEEVVAVGYGIQKKVNLTGAIATVQGEKLLSAVSTPNLSNSLAGLMPGLTIQQNTGRPGATSAISMRGASPIYVIDGIIRSKENFDAIDPNEIETISILKDAASAAVYGARSAGGVMLVTTKQGTIGTPKITFKAVTSIDERTFKMDHLSAYEAAILSNDYNTLNNVVPTSAVYYTPDELEEYKNNASTYPNWFEMMWKNPVSQIYNLNVNGGSDKIKYFMSAGYYNGTGCATNIGSTKQNLRINVEANIAKNLVAEVKFDMNFIANKAPMWPNDAGNFDLNANLNAMQIRLPTKRPYFDGLPVSYVNENNPFEAAKHGYFKNYQDTYNGIIGLTYSVPWVKGLKLNARYNQSRSTVYDKNFFQNYTTYNFTLSGGNSHLIQDGATVIKSIVQSIVPYEYIYQSYDRGFDYQLNAMISYNNTFGKHDISGVLAYEQAESNSENFNGKAQDLLSSSIDYMFAASADPTLRTVTGSASETGRESYIGRLNYAYAGKFLIESSFRYDGSVNFPSNKRWGLFPSVSAGWRISEEPWFKNRIKFIDNMKLRASIGQLGNDNVKNFQYLDQFAISTNPVYYSQAFRTIYSTGVPTYDITWEKSRTYNTGLDIGLFKNRLTFTGEVYYKKTFDILKSSSSVTPGTFGASMPDENFGINDYKGFELSLGYNGKISKDLSYYVNGNVGYTTDRVLKDYIAANQPAYSNPIGRTSGVIWGFETEGILRTQEQLDEYLTRVKTIYGVVPRLGMLALKDVRSFTDDNKDGIIDANDKQILSYNSTPRYNYGFSFGANWHGLALDILFQGIGQWDRMISQVIKINANTTVPLGIWRDHWTPDNINARMPIIDDQTTNGTFKQPSDLWLVNAAFLRLKNLTASYKLPKSITSKIGADDIIFSFTGTNLFLWSKFPYYDPEQSEIGSYPIVKTFTFGFNVTFK